MQPVMGNRAMIMAAGRAEFSDDAIEDKGCFSASCLSVASVIDDAALWSEPKPDNARAGSTFPLGGNGSLSPTLAVDLLLGTVDSIETDMPAATPVRPAWAIEAIVENNLGQDLGIEAAYRWHGLLDDAISAAWKRVVVIEMGREKPQLYWAQAFECARKQETEPEAVLCP